MGEVATVRRQALDGALACSQYPLVVGVGISAVRILHDFLGQLAIDRSTEPVHADSRLLSPLPGHFRSGASIPALYEIHLTLRVNHSLSRLGACTLAFLVSI